MAIPYMHTYPAYLWVLSPQGAPPPGPLTPPTTFTPGNPSPTSSGHTCDHLKKCLACLRVPGFTA